ncbi:OmpW family protein [Acinetobacter sp. Root1280]|uniref:OmpW/AlkL family protein n=1 Tax=Acinetobacter sp. Root1280 TaxID=1736444 RepID=UPI0006F70578|nr:OmpW family outer membrane protein [Acinetobacter sp. Root1280]KQW88294.1 OmpW family protein [Acinetobacter sp. Root1280]
MKKIIKTLLPITLVCVMPLTHAATSEGKTWAVSAGWLHVMPQGKKQGVFGQITDKAPILKNTPASSPGAGFEVQDDDTAGLILDYFINDNVSLELVLGAPPEMELSGKGQINIPFGGIEITAANLDKFDKVATTDAYTPTFLAKYHFGSVNNKLRPYLGAGVMYAHFSDVQADPNINAELNSNAILALLKPELGKIKVDDAFAPVVIAGLDYNINKSWFATASVSYAHLSTNAELNVIGNTELFGANIPRDTILKGKSKIEINPVVTYLGIGYRF